MSYLGQVELKSSEIRRIDVTGSTSATHTLTWTPPSEQSLIVTINGVKQQNNYTISGTTLTLDTALIVTDALEVVGILDIGTTNIPADDSITNAMVKSSAAIALSKLATDPSNASNLASGTVPTARLGSGSASSSTILYGDNTWAAPPAEYNDAGLQDDIALLGFKVATNGSLAKYNLVDQAVDDFQDTSGVDASASTGEARDSSGKYYKGEASTTPTASGGTITTDGDYTIHKFTADANYINDSAQTVDYLLVAGGGGGGGVASGVDGAGGGGAGGFRYLTGNSMAAGTFAAVIGQGGTAGPATGGTQGSDGTATTFNSVSAAGGGGGGCGAGGGGTDGRDGGSGGGGGTTSQDGGSGNTPSTDPVQGYDGGTTGGANGASGGGGASAAGVNGTHFTGRDGGAGAANSITGASVTYAGGGGSGGKTGYAVGAGGAGGGGAGGSVAGTDELGGGGGGAQGGSGSAGADGGNGIFILRRPTVDVAEGADMSLASTATTAESAPTKGDIVCTITNGAGTTTVNTDIKGYISRDNGSNYTQFTLASQGTTGGHTILSGHDLDISSQPSGTAMKWKITTHNQSASKTTRIQAVSLGWS